MNTKSETAIYLWIKNTINKNQNIFIFHYNITVHTKINKRRNQQIKNITKQIKSKNQRSKLMKVEYKLQRL